MTFWTSAKLKDGGPQIFQPYDEAQVENAGYELKMGPEAYVSGAEQRGKTQLAEGQTVVIPPGQFALLLTEEIVTIPVDALGFISMKLGLKQAGLVNVSGFHVDPGFHGRLIFSVYNAGGTEIVISRGRRAFILWLASLSDRDTEPYDQTHAHYNQLSISDNAIVAIGRNQFSPAALDQRVKELEVQVGVWSGLLKGVIVAVAAAAVVWLVGRVVDNQEPVRRPTPATSVRPSPTS